MTIDDLRGTLAFSSPPAGLPATIVALWYDARGDWEAAHRVAQDVDDEEGAWIHAYLHRKEGDPGNAAYWYRRAGRKPAAGSLDDEWTAIATALLPKRS